MVKKNNDQELVKHWREVGPVAWAEGSFGWVGIDGALVNLIPWQRAVLEAWWAHREAVSTLAISCIKKSGKTFLDGVLLAWRWLALPGEHYAVGNDMDQSAGRQYSEISAMIKRNPYLKLNTTANKGQLIFRPTDSTITALAVDAAGNAGANHLTASHTESWGIVYENGVRAYEELTPPPGAFYGFPALRICDSYAGYEGESDTWHNLVDRGLKGERVSDEWPIFLSGGLLLFHIEGEEARRRCFRGTQAQASAYYTEQKADLRPGTFQRLHENKRATGSEQFIDLDQWDACVDPEHRPILPGETLLFCGVDASVKNDSAAVLAVTYNRESRKVELARHRIWKPTARDPLDIDETIGNFLRELHAGYRLVAAAYDPYQMHDLATRLRKEGLPMLEYPQSMPNLTAMSQNLFELIQAGNLRMYASEELRKMAGHAIAVQGARGWRIAKEKATNKIDGIVALGMAALQAIENGTAYHSLPEQPRQESRWKQSGAEEPWESGYQAGWAKRY